MILILTIARGCRATIAKRRLATLLVALLAITSCGSNDTVDDSTEPTVVVTTNILGDVVENLVGDDVTVVVIMDVGTDPHEFQASAKQVAQIGEAGALVANGAGFEEGLIDVIESAEQDGVPVFEAVSAIASIDSDEEEQGDEDDHDGEEEHDGEDEEEHDEHGHDGVDPHFFTDPARMAAAAEAIADFLAENVEGLEVPTLQANTQRYISQLEALDAEIEAELEELPKERRILVTNHDVFGYFADRYDFDIIGTVIPSGTTVDAASAQTLAELAATIEAAGVPAIFADVSSSSDIAATLADEVGGIAVIELFSESLGADDSDGATYINMIRSNASRIVEALAG